MARQKIRLPLAKKICDILGPLCGINPFNKPSSTVFLRRANKLSAHIRNIYGERRSPWCKPREGIIWPRGHNLNSYPGDNITKIDGSILVDLHWIFYFWDEHYMSFVEFWGNNTMVQKIKDSLRNTITN